MSASVPGLVDQEENLTLEVIPGCHQRLWYALTFFQIMLPVTLPVPLPMKRSSVTADRKEHSVHSTERTSNVAKRTHRFAVVNDSHKRN